MPQHPGDVIAQRVTLRARARPVRRGVGEVQFGLNPEHGIVMAGLSEAEAGWLLSLDGAPQRPSTPLRRGPGVLLTSAGGWGLSASRALELLDVLHAHGLVVEESTRPGRGHAGVAARDIRDGVVVVLGRGAVPDSIRDHLRTAGTAGVSEVFDPTQPPALTVLVVRDAVGPRDRTWWVRSGQAHLPVVISHHRAVLGPLLGNSADGPCLTCLDLTRRDRDTAWPLIAAQLGHSPSDWAAEVSTEPTLSTTVASLTTMLVRAHLRSLSPPVGVTWEVALPWPHVTTRQWPRHLACGEHP
ncbi:MAG: hypothetical protein WA962_13640 [Ornithinimicrobium sp.]